MKKYVLIISVLTLSLFAFYSCNNTSTEKKTTEDEKETSKIEIKYLEDFTQFKNHEEVVEFFGEDNVVKNEYWESEGTIMFPVTIINPESKNRVVIYWKDSQEKYEDLQSVEARYSSYTSDGEMTKEKGVIYPTKVGVELGTKIDELEELNGKVFTFFGLAWDYGGIVLDLEPKFGDYAITLGCPKADEMEEYSPEYEAIIGDSEFKSNDENAVSLGLEVVSIKYVGK
jgi:hypothetical protein